MNHPTVSISPHDPYGSISVSGIDPNNIFGDQSLIIETVKGDMILIEKKLSVNELEKSYDQSFVDDLKKQMALELAEKILQNKYVEFTKQEDLKNGEVVYRARAYITPDEQIRKIRKSEK